MTQTWQLADVAAMMRRMISLDPGRPRVTWYGAAGERVEFSAKVLDNWVAKTANLLVNELDAGPGVIVQVDLPTHWRTLVWLLATWSTGAQAVVAAPPQLHADSRLRLDVLVSCRPAVVTVPRGAQLVAVALPSLASSFGPGLPAGAIDAAVDVRSQGDLFVPLVRPVGSDPAFSAGDDVTISYQTPCAGAAEAVRLLTGAGPGAALGQWVAPLMAGGSVVLHHDLTQLDADTLARLIRQEGITAQR